MVLSNRVLSDVRSVTCHPIAVPTATRKRMASIHVMSMGVMTLCSIWPPKYRAQDTSGATVE